MALLTLKWLAALIIFLICLSAGFVTLKVAKKYQRQLQFGDAIANGVFIGTALFHLFPDAASGFESIAIKLAYTYSLLLILFTYIILLILDRLTSQRYVEKNIYIKTWLLSVTISIHALITGITLGIADSLTIVSILSIAIIAHKGFESFALVVKLHHYLQKQHQLIIVLLLFSLVTPTGIILGMLVNTLLKSNVNSLLTACFSALAAGTFLFIGLSHSHHKVYRKEIDSYRRYPQVLATLAGMALMAVLAIWI